MPAARTIPKIVYIAPLSLLAMLLVAWVAMMFIMRGPLAGKNKHDFGEVSLARGETAVLSHAFQFTNRIAKPITINWARPDCGCVVIDMAFPQTIQPGESFELPIKMHYSGLEPKSVNIRIHCGDAGIQNAWVSAQPGKRSTAKTIDSPGNQSGDQSQIKAAQ